ncbi:hypothetical protein GVX82_01855 [Patescibacteria group bacterium]|jgi:ribulose-phosphate 3-epimerase|nr:hypothetical protein [Patescibacteria group bacterium]
MIEHSSFPPEIIPAIIPKSWRDIPEQVELVHKYVARVQVDVMGGLYTPEPSWPYNDVDVTRFRDLVEEREGLPHWETLDFEIDMMTCDPEDKISDWIAAGASTLIIHKHSTTDDVIDRIIQKAGERGVGIALALKPTTANDELAPFIERISFVQCMGNDRIGFHKVPLDEVVYDKIRDLTARWDIPVGVDIGVNRETAPRLIEAGATRLVSGSAIFGKDDIAENIAALKGV